MRVLLVEDDPHTAAFVVKGLREDGHAVDQAGDGKQGLFLATTETYDAIVLDRMLPGLDGMVLLVEGLGKASDGSIVHQALGVISYDQGTNEYKFKTYLRDGKSGDAWLKPTGENKFQWGLDIPGRGKIRYSINIDTAKKTWNEIGEFSQDGTTWMKFFEMSLTKVE